MWAYATNTTLLIGENMAFKDIKDKLLKTIYESGEAICSDSKKMFSTKSDGSLVSDVDQLIEKKLHRALKESIPNVLFIGEESWNTTNPQEFSPSSTIAVVDPLDGTSAFAAGIKLVAITLGIVDQKTSSFLGLIYLPYDGIGLLSESTQNETKVLQMRKTTRNTIEAHPFNMNQFKLLGDPLSSYVLVDPHVHRSINLDRFPGKIVSLPSTAASFLFLLRKNVYSGLICSMNSMSWDILGGVFIAAEMGFKFKNLETGMLIRPIDFLRDLPNIPCPFLVAPPQIINPLSDYFQILNRGH